MKTGYLIYLTAHALQCFRWCAGQLERDGTFANDESGHRQFALYLTHARKESFVALANIAEESFANETIPNLSSSDRTTIIGRRLEQRFPEAQFTASISLAHARPPDNNEELLLAAFTRHDNITPWLRLITSAGIVLNGIYSLSLLAPTALRIISPAGRNCLLLTQQDQSIRQSHVKEGKLQFSRLTSLSGLSEERIAERFIEAATRLRLYLISQRLLDHGTPIMTCVIATPPIAEILRSYSREGDAPDIDVIDIPDSCRRAGIKSAPTESQCEALFLGLAALSPPKTQYADPFMREESRLRRTGRYLFVAGGIAMAASLLTSATLYLLAHGINTTIDQSHREVAQARARLDALQRSLPAVPVGDAHIQSLIIRHHRLYPRTGGPGQLFQEISRALVSTPTVEIERIEWALANDKDAGKKDMTPARQAPREIATVHGHVRSAQGERQQTMATQIRRFVAALKETSRIGVSTVRLSGDESADAVPSTGAPTSIRTRSFIIELSRNENP